MLLKITMKYNKINLIQEKSTVGIDFYKKIINFKDSSLTLQIWDSAGQEKYKSLIPSYVRGAAMVFIIYDVSSKTINFYYRKTKF
jgi:GTPase SAR1 family protein